MDTEPTEPVPYFLGSGGITCAFLRQTFPNGPPSDFRIAEIGVRLGDTSIEFAKLLPKDGILHLFDFESVVQKAKQGLPDEANHTNVVAFGCSTKERDSYNWPLMRLLAGNPLPINDYVYVEGAHTWDVDGLAFFLLDRLLKPGGYMTLR